MGSSLKSLAAGDVGDIVQMVVLLIVVLVSAISSILASKGRKEQEGQPSEGPPGQAPRPKPTVPGEPRRRPIRPVPPRAEHREPATPPTPGRPAPTVPPQPAPERPAPPQPIRVPRSIERPMLRARARTPKPVRREPKMPIPRTAIEKPIFQPTEPRPGEKIVVTEKTWAAQQIPQTIEQWRRAIVLAEVLGPPLALRSPDWAGPTSPPALW